MESASETIPPWPRGATPLCAVVRVKTCGKSARANSVTGSWGKPHPEQDRAADVLPVHYVGGCVA